MLRAGLVGEEHETCTFVGPKAKRRRVQVRYFLVWGVEVVEIFTDEGCLDVPWKLGSMVIG